MREIKPGDRVRYVKDYDSMDTQIFKIGSFYTVYKVVDAGVYVIESSRGLTFNQIVLPPADNPVNRLLYPELKPDGKGYLDEI